MQNFRKRFDSKLGKVAVKDCSKLFQEVTSIKTAEEIASLRICAKFTEFIFKELIERVETVIDEQRTDKHN